MRPDETPAAELWRRTLAQIPTTFGRLVYLASLRNPNTGQYQHFGFAQRFSERESDRTLKRSHTNVFSDWLCFSLEQQRNDLEIYLEESGEDKLTIISNWLELPPFMNWIPTQTREAERDLFRADLMTVLEIVKREYAVASSGPAA